MFPKIPKLPPSLSPEEHPLLNPHLYWKMHQSQRNLFLSLRRTLRKRHRRKAGLAARKWANLFGKWSGLLISRPPRKL